MKRRFQAYCVGTGRSGTRSIAGILASCYRTEHEPDGVGLHKMITAKQRGHINQEVLKRYVLKLDNKLQLELNSSYLNNRLLDIFVPEFPNAKFILTMRDCYSWLNSVINDSFLQYPKFPIEKERFREMVEKSHYPYLSGGTSKIDSILAYWAKINTQILRMIPKTRLLVVRTHEIENRSSDIAKFLDIPLETLDITKAHMGKSREYPNILSRIDRDYLFSKVELRCKPLMDQFFPSYIYNFE